MKQNNLKFLILALALIMAFSTTKAVFAAIATPTPKPTATQAPVRNLLAICQRQQTEIKKNLFSAITLAQSMTSQIDNIHTKVLNHYSIISLPAQKTLTNLEVLEKAISSDKETIDSSLIKEALAINLLTCSPTNPLSSFIQAGQDLQKTVEVISDYKSKVKNLILAIIAVDKNQNPSPAPSLTPSPSPTSSSNTSPSPSTTANPTSSPGPSSTQAATPSPLPSSSQAPGANGQ